MNLFKILIDLLTKYLLMVLSLIPIIRVLLMKYTELDAKNLQILLIIIGEFKKYQNFEINIRKAANSEIQYLVVKE